MQLRNNLNTFTLKELKKDIIKMKAVTQMKRDQIIELILAYHYLFPHLLTKQGSKRSSVSRKRINDQLINQLLNNHHWNSHPPRQYPQNPKNQIFHPQVLSLPLKYYE